MDEEGVLLNSYPFAVFSSGGRFCNTRISYTIVSIFLSLQFF